MENSLYTPEVRHLITTAPWPEAFKYVVTETDEGLWMIMYVGTYEALSHDDKMTVYRLINETFPKINKLGIPIGLKTKEGFRPAQGV